MFVIRIREFSFCQRNTSYNNKMLWQLVVFNSPDVFLDFSYLLYAIGEIKIYVSLKRRMFHFAAFLIVVS